MIDQALEWANRWGNLIGFLLTFCGLIWTVIGVYRSKNAADAAKAAALETKSLLLHSESIVELAAALSIMDEIRRLHRASVWIVLPDRYALLRNKLIAIRTANPQISDDHRMVLSRAVEEFKSIESRVERALANGGSPANPPKLNEIVGVQIDALNEVLTTLKLQLRDS